MEAKLLRVELRHVKGNCRPSVPPSLAVSAPGQQHCSHLHLCFPSLGCEHPRGTLGLVALGANGLWNHRTCLANIVDGTSELRVWLLNSVSVNTLRFREHS